MELNAAALETSFDLVAPRGEQLMDEFYARLFDTARAVAPLFAAMATIAGTAWLPEHESAWRDAFALVAAAMLDGAKAAHPTIAALGATA